MIFLKDWFLSNSIPPSVKCQYLCCEINNISLPINKDPYTNHRYQISLAGRLKLTKLILWQHFTAFQNWRPSLLKRPISLLHLIPGICLIKMLISMNLTGFQIRWSPPNTPALRVMISNTKLWWWWRDDLHYIGLLFCKVYTMSHLVSYNRCRLVPRLLFLHGGEYYD